ELEYPICNSDRTVGAALSGALALEFGSTPPPGSALVRFTGSAGQSFGAFLGHGIEFELTGEANDYVAKAMAGGRIVVRPPANTFISWHEAGGQPVLAGNTCLYGATGGELYIAGSAGERFGVRNSGATAVVEGVGDHACEYMTGGTVVILGPVGYNLGAGMTGGEAYVWDPGSRLAARLNAALVEAVRPDGEHVEELRWLVERHFDLTGSPRARALIDDWQATIEQIWHVLPVGRVDRIEAAQAGRGGAAA
ncbi:MAG TPA: glutamate synthase subunit alpha, partial [Acidimicrobiales bacterium]|nr:glutamate synthase subunit alpha [Acidimicrobiales bacterium]